MKLGGEAKRAGSYSKRPGDSKVQFFFQKLCPQSTAEPTSPIKTLQGFTNERAVPSNVLNLAKEERVQWMFLKFSRVLRSSLPTVS
jgi:hypothetical protein